MSDPGLTLLDVVRHVRSRVAHRLTVVECGTIRNPSFEGHEDGLATYHLARAIRDEGLDVDFVSCELSHGTMVACRRFLRVAGLQDSVTFALADAAPFLQHFAAPIDVVYLDAGADPVANLAQYRHACTWLRTPGAVLIDDVFDRRNADRGLVTVPYARLEGRRVACLHGRHALISFGLDDYSLPEGSVWL